MAGIGSNVRAAITRLLDWLDDKVSAPAEEAARRRGHSMKRIPGSRTRVYRNDALWDQVREWNELLAAGELDADQPDAEEDEAGEGDMTEPDDRPPADDAGDTR